MSRHKRVLPAVLVAGIALLVGAGASVLRAQDQITFEDAHIFFEFNSSAEDLGIQVFVDGEPWKSLVIVDPDGKKIVDVKGKDVKGKGTLKGLGLTELFYESDEPSFADLPLEEILALFPEGEYHFFGVTVEGEKMVGTKTLTHDIPNGPVILSPVGGLPVDPSNTVISWLPVTTPAGIQIVRYHVTVENGGRVLDVDLPATATSMTVPKEFLEPATEYKFEVLAKEVSENQTITEGSFETE